MFDTQKFVQAKVEKWRDERLLVPGGGWVGDTMCLLLTVMEDYEPRLWASRIDSKEKYMSLLQVARQYFSQAKQRWAVRDAFFLGRRIEQDASFLSPEKREAFVNEAKVYLGF